MSTENKPSEERVEAAARRIAEICGYPAVTPIDPLWIAHASDVLAAADAAGAQQAAPSGEAVATVGFSTQQWRALVVALTELPDGTKLYTHPAPAPAAVPAGWMPIEKKVPE